MHNQSAMIGSSKIPKIPFFLLSLLLCANAAESHWKKPDIRPVAPLCASQLTLVNHACSFLMFNPSPPLPPRLPLLAPPAAPEPRPPHRRHRRRGGALRRHHGGGGHHHSPEEEICCRWLKEVDDQCVCDMLVTLPPFLARPLHQYTVMVGESCFQSYQCGSPIRIND